MEIKFDKNYEKSFDKISEKEKAVVAKSVEELKQHIEARLAHLDIDDKLYGKTINQYNIGYKVINDTLIIMNFWKNISNMVLLNLSQRKPMDRDPDYSDDGGLDPDGNPTRDNQPQEPEKKKHTIVTLISLTDIQSGIRQLAQKMSKRVKDIEDMEDKEEISSNVAEARIDQVYEDKNPVTYKNKNGYNVSLEFNDGQDAD